jgi:hypothetical protein
MLMKRPLLALSILIILGTFLRHAKAQTDTVIPANLAAGDVGEYATVEGSISAKAPARLEPF